MESRKGQQMNEVKGIKVQLLSHFNVIRETLERIGIVNKNTKTLYPSCYLLHKRTGPNKDSEYYIIHFKNLFLLDGKVSNLTEEDELRQTAIAKLLERWGIVKIISQENVIEKDQYPFLFVLGHDKKDEYTIKHKYTIGTYKN